MNVPVSAALHFQQLFDKLNKLRCEDDFSDVTLGADNGVNIQAHKLILAAASPYFETMFKSSSKFLESDQNKIKLKDVSGDSLRVLIDYIYTGKIIISEDNVEDILIAANFLQLQAVKDTCANVLMEKITVSNCLGIHLLADSYHCPSLKI